MRAPFDPILQPIVQLKPKEVKDFKILIKSCNVEVLMGTLLDLAITNEENGKWMLPTYKGESPEQYIEFEYENIYSKGTNSQGTKSQGAINKTYNVDKQNVSFKSPRPMSQSQQMSRHDFIDEGHRKQSNEYLQKERIGLQKELIRIDKVSIKTRSNDDSKNRNDDDNMVLN